MHTITRNVRGSLGNERGGGGAPTCRLIRGGGGGGGGIHWRNGVSTGGG